MSKQTSWQRRVPEENSMLTTSASVKRRLSSEHLQSQNYRGMTTTCCPGSNRSFWWGFAPVITDWTVICTVNWSWHPRQLAPVVEKSRPWRMFYKDAPSTKPQEKTCGLSAPPWRPNSTAASRSWRRRRHSSPERPWSCRLRTPRRRRRSLKEERSHHKNRQSKVLIVKDDRALKFLKIYFVLYYVERYITLVLFIIKTAS